MEVLLLRKPYEVAFSGNPVAFTFIVTPYTDVEHGQDIGLNVTVEVEEGFNTQVFTAARQDIYLPDAKGQIEIPVQHILQAYLTQYVPSLNLSTAVVCEGQTRRYRITYQLIANKAIATQSTTTEIFTVIKSGMPYEEWHPKRFFTDYISNKNLFLRYTIAEEKVHADELKFLNWLYPSDAREPMKAIARVQYSNNSQEQKDISALFSCNKWQICITPAGFRQLGLDALGTNNRIPLSYDISVVNAQGAIIVAPQRFVLDYRNFYNTYNIMYAGSLGGIETLRLRGQVEAHAEYQKTIVDRVTPSNYFERGILQSPSAATYATENEKFTGDTGFIPKQKMDRLRDLFLSRDCLYEVRNGKLIPIAIDAKSVKLFTTTDKLYSMSIDWRNGFTNEYYAPDNLLSAVSATCPSPVSFFVRQIQKSYLQVLWALEPEYYQVQIQFPGNSGQEVTTLQGNTGQEKIFFKNPRIAFPANLSPITVRARTVCNSDISPASVSAWVDVSLTPVGNYAPIAIDDNFTMPRGITTLTQLDGNVLANDYDPDGDPIKCVPVNNDSTGKGGKITIAADGKVAYSAPTSVFEGEDTYYYTIQQVDDPTVTASAFVRIIVGSPTTGSVVYAKIVFRNVVSQWQIVGGPPLPSTIYVTKAQVWVDFFADALGSLPVDVTSLNLTINYQTTLKYVTPAVSTVQSHTAAATGDKKMIHQDTVSVQYGTGNFINYNIEFKLTAGTGYSIL